MGTNLFLLNPVSRCVAYSGAWIAKWQGSHRTSRPRGTGGYIDTSGADHAWSQKREAGEALWMQVQVQATTAAFAAIPGDGSIATWGDAGHGG